MKLLGMVFGELGMLELVDPKFAKCAGEFKKLRLAKYYNTYNMIAIKVFFRWWA